jgi:glycosyltransferase involved in cell wall biosynthesis/beta-glucanase (GH16 family)
MQTSLPTLPIRVFVHLARGFGAQQWRAKWELGAIIGLNDPLPYGYAQAEAFGCTVEYSQDNPENLLGRTCRLALRLVLGFDVVHAWRNRHGIFAAEIVWTHTESQHLAVLLLLRAFPLSRRPKVIAQSVWLFDSWSRLSPLKRWLYHRLLAEADAVTVLSPVNLSVAQSLFPLQRCQMMPYGIPAEKMIRRAPRPISGSLQILSLGSDRHRDWRTLVDAVEKLPNCELRIVAPQLPPALTRGANVTLVHPRSNTELAALYDWADLVALALTPNLHASGITVVEEATAFGVPVICTDTGGLTAYFAEGEVCYVAPGDPEALRAAMTVLAADNAARERMVEQAQRKMREAGLTSRRYAQRHAELSHQLLRAPAPEWTRLREAAQLMPLCVLALIIAALAIANFDSAQSAVDLCRQLPTFTEDFNELSVSPWGANGSRWIAHTPWNGDFGDAAFTDPQSGFPFRVEHGVLDIEARKGADGKWQSGLLASATPTNTGFAQRYGYFEMRAELPPGPGTWPGFWLNSNQPHDSKTPGVEIDVIEYYGQFPDAYHSAVHVWNKADPKNNRVEDHVTSVPYGSLTSGFHTFGVDVEPDWITFYLDRRETWHVRTPSELADNLMVLVDLALGSGWPIDRTPNPSVMKIDYVHTFAPPTSATAGGGCHGD